jgi:hypothetical protein
MLGSSQALPNAGTSTATRPRISTIKRWMFRACGTSCRTFCGTLRSRGWRKGGWQCFRVGPHRWPRQYHGHATLHPPAGRYRQPDIHIAIAGRNKTGHTKKTARGKRRAAGSVRPQANDCSLFTLVPGRGVEPRRAEARRILSPLRLPVPPSRRGEDQQYRITHPSR